MTSGHKSRSDKNGLMEAFICIGTSSGKGWSLVENELTDLFFFFFGSRIFTFQQSDNENI